MLDWERKPPLQRTETCPYQIPSVIRANSGHERNLLLMWWLMAPLSSLKAKLHHMVLVAEETLLRLDSPWVLFLHHGSLSLLAAVGMLSVGWGCSLSYWSRSAQNQAKISNLTIILPLRIFSSKRNTALLPSAERRSQPKLLTQRKRRDCCWADRQVLATPLWAERTGWSARRAVHEEDGDWNPDWRNGWRKAWGKRWWRVHGRKGRASPRKEASSEGSGPDLFVSS